MNNKTKSYAKSKSVAQSNKCFANVSWKIQLRQRWNHSIHNKVQLNQFFIDYDCTDNKLPVKLYLNKEITFNTNKYHMHTAVIDITHRKVRSTKDAR